MPLITVLLPVYNAEKYLKEALESLENQSFKDFEVLILEDGCRDKSGETALKFQEKDKRFQWISRKENLGITKTLNQGLKLADSQYIARMDADDISLPQRFEKQIKLMQENFNIISCGTQVQFFDNQGFSYNYLLPIKAENIFVEWIYRPALVHATSLTRRDIFKELRYDTDFLYAEDYHLWGEMLLKGKLHNTRETLYTVRNHKERVSQKHNALQNQNKKRVFKIWLERLGISPSENDLDLHFEIFGGKDNIDIHYIERVGEWLEKLHLQNQRTKIFPEPNFTNLLKRTWAKYTLGFSHLGISFWNIWKKNTLSEGLLTDFQKQKFWLKCLLKK